MELDHQQPDDIKVDRGCECGRWRGHHSHRREVVERMKDHPSRSALLLGEGIGGFQRLLPGSARARNGFPSVRPRRRQRLHQVERSLLRLGSVSRWASRQG